jgi:protein-S-isoprenylcysteine O-methyltransferase Ste14
MVPVAAPRHARRHWRRIVITRLMYFVYGVTAYLVFLVTFLYAIAFVGGFAVPTRLDGPLQGPWQQALAIDVALLTVFAAQHSVMARRWFKDRWTRVVPWAIERSTYVLCASLALLLLFWQWRPLGVSIWTMEDTVLRALIWTLFAAGWATVLVVTFLINHFDLFGLRQVWLPLVGRPYTRVAFRTPLPYRVVRHPLYLGFLFAFWMTPTMTLAHLVFAIATTAYIVLAIQFEERDLVAEHGPAYAAYRGTVPMLLPWRVTGRAAERLAGTRRVVSCLWPVVGSAGVLVGAAVHPVAAQQGQTSAHVEAAHDRRPTSGGLVKTVREATERFRDVAVAEAEGYALMFGCVSGPDWGAMGLHYPMGTFSNWHSRVSCDAFSAASPSAR